MSSKTRCHFCNNPPERTISIRYTKIYLCTYCSEDVAEQLIDVSYNIYWKDLEDTYDKIDDALCDLEHMIRETKKRMMAVVKESGERRQK